MLTLRCVTVASSGPSATTPTSAKIQRLTARQRYQTLRIEGRACMHGSMHAHLTYRISTDASRHTLSHYSLNKHNNCQPNTCMHKICMHAKHAPMCGCMHACMHAWKHACTTCGGHQQTSSNTERTTTALTTNKCTSGMDNPIQLMQLQCMFAYMLAGCAR